MQAADVDNAFKYISLQIGSNDLCSACYGAETGNRQHSPLVHGSRSQPKGIGPLSADAFEAAIQQV